MLTLKKSSNPLKSYFLFKNALLIAVRFCILAIMMDKSTILKKINDRNHGTLMQTLGIEFTEIGENYLVARMPVSPAVHQPDGVPRCATAALAETVGSSAAAIFCLPKDHMLRGIDVSATCKRCSIRICTCKGNG